MDKRLNPNLVWAFALAAVGLSIGAAYAMPHASTKVWGAIFFALFGGLGAASTFLTDAKRSTAALAFGAAALVFGIFVYIIIQHAIKAAGASMGHSSAGSTVGSAFGMIYGIAYFIDALAAGIAGVMFGRKFQKGVGSLSARRA